MYRWLPVLSMLLMPTLQAAPGSPIEVKVGTAVILDYEFDWGRDGTYCPSCNGGAGNSRLVYADASGNLWVGAVDPVTGYFIPPDGKGSLVDTLAAGPGRVGNGPEWAFSQRGSEIVYTRWIEGAPQRIPYVDLGVARQIDGVWLAGPVDNTLRRLNPYASWSLDDPAAREAYTDDERLSLYWREMYAGAPEHVVIASYPRGSSIPRRWVDGTTDLILTAPAAPDPELGVHTQVFLFHCATGLMEQLTFDATDKVGAYMWNAPEFGGASVFLTVAGGGRIVVYRRNAGDSDAPAWDAINTIAMPADTPYAGSPGVFIHNGTSWIFFWASADAANKAGPSRIALTGIDPAMPTLRTLTPLTDPPRSRRDPEYFITANGPYIYYDRYAADGSAGAMTHEGVYRVDTGLGPRHP